MLSKNYKLSEELSKALNDQMKMEFYSSCLCLSASHFFALENLKGFALWFEKKSKEEYEHALKFLSLFRKFRVTPSFGMAAQTIPKWENYGNILKEHLEHEKAISTEIHRIYGLAESEGDVVVCDFLRWFVKEQLEEENIIIELNDLYRYYNQKQAGLIDMDRLLAKRCETENKNG